MTGRPVVLDLYCGAGGAAWGYHLAGFEVVGVDITDQPRYPFRFWNFDALQVLRVLLSGSTVNGYSLADFDAIHASPPCQRYSLMSACRPGLAEKYPDLIEPTRFLLKRIGLPFVIENVPGSPLHDPVRLCGTHFDRRVFWQGHGTFELQRHRDFEASFPLPSLGGCTHRFPSFPVYGHNRAGNRPDLKGPGFAALARKVMGVSWMRRDELAESIPPCFSHWVGVHLRRHLDGWRDAA